MPRVHLIYNPEAGRTGRRGRDIAASSLERAGWDVRMVRTEREDHARDLARDAVDSGADSVAVYGGDGTVIRALDGVVGHEIPIGIIPGGTGNQLARNLRLPRSPEQAARRMIRGHTRPLDLGELDVAGRTTCFAVGCGAGFDAEIICTATPAMKRWLGVGAYIARGLTLAPSLVPTPVRVEVDGRPFETDAASVIVANCPRLFPPYRPVHPDISYDDGVLDVLVLRTQGVWRTLSLLARLVLQADDPRRILHLRGSEIRVESATPLRIQRDGEAGGTTPFRVRVRPCAVRVFV